MKKIPASVEILTCNSAATLEQCLQSVKDFDDIIVLDGNSTDTTKDIAKRYGVRIIPQVDTDKKNVRIEHFSEVRNKGIKLAQYEWFLYVDSDEYLSPEVVGEIREIVAKEKENTYFIYQMPRQHVLNGKVVAKIRPSFQVRFFYLPAVEGFIKRVHERIQPKVGYEIGRLQYSEYVPLESLDELKQKWSRYIDMQLADLTITPRVLFLKTRANLVKFIKYWVKYLIVLVTNPGQRLPFWYEFHNTNYHLKIIWRLWKKFLFH